RVLDGPDGGLAARTGALDDHVDLADAVLHGAASALLGSHLCGVRSGLLGALEPDVASRRPGESVPVLVADRHDGVVERALDVRHPVGDVLALALAGTTAPRPWLRHRSILRGVLQRGDRVHLRTFFLPATVFLGPLRVRAL